MVKILKYWIFTNLFFKKYKKFLSKDIEGLISYIYISKMSLFDFYAKVIKRTETS